MNSLHSIQVFIFLIIAIIPLESLPLNKQEFDPLDTEAEMDDDNVRAAIGSASEPGMGPPAPVALVDKEELTKKQLLDCDPFGPFMPGCPPPGGPRLKERDSVPPMGPRELNCDPLGPLVPGCPDPHYPRVSESE